MKKLLAPLLVLMFILSFTHALETEQGTQTIEATYTEPITHKASFVLVSPLTLAVHSVRGSTAQHTLLREIPLAIGDNYYTIFAADEKGNTAYYDERIVTASTQLSIDLIEPSQNGMTTRKQDVTVTIQTVQGAQCEWAYYTPESLYPRTYQPMQAQGTLHTIENFVSLPLRKTETLPIVVRCSTETAQQAERVFDIGYSGLYEEQLNVDIFPINLGYEENPTIYVTSNKVTSCFVYNDDQLLATGQPATKHIFRDIIFTSDLDIIDVRCTDATGQELATKEVSITPDFAHRTLDIYAHSPELTDAYETVFAVETNLPAKCSFSGGGAQPELGAINEPLLIDVQQPERDDDRIHQRGYFFGLPGEIDFQITCERDELTAETTITHAPNTIAPLVRHQLQPLRCEENVILRLTETTQTTDITHVVFETDGFAAVREFDPKGTWDGTQGPIHIQHHMPDAQIGSAMTVRGIDSDGRVGDAHALTLADANDPNCIYLGIEQEIHLVEPATGGTDLDTFDVIIESEFPSSCTWQTNLGTSGTLQQLTTTRHSIPGFETATGIQRDSTVQLVVFCSAPSGDITEEQFDISWIQDAPIFTVTANPNPITDIEHPQSVITVTSDQPVRCNFADETTQTPTHYSTLVEHTVAVPYGLGEREITVTCENQVGTQVTESITIRSGYPSELMIDVDMDDTSTEQTVRLRVQTNLPSTCTARVGQQDVVLEETGELFTYEQTQTLADGIYNILFSCEEETTGQPANTYTHQLTVDTNKPHVLITSPQQTCLPNGYLVTADITEEVGLSQVLVYWDGQLLGDLREEPFNIQQGTRFAYFLDGLALAPGQIYSVQVSAIDLAGQVSDFSMQQVEVPSVEVGDCDTQPPVGRIHTNPTLIGTEVTVFCDDDQACQDGFSLGTGAPDGQCLLEPTQYSLGSSTYHVLVTETAKICFEVRDFAGNIHAGSEVIFVNSYPDHCFNEKFDDGEVQIDCGGNCPSCDTVPPAGVLRKQEFFDHVDVTLDWQDNSFEIVSEHLFGHGDQNQPITCQLATFFFPDNPGFLSLTSTRHACWELEDLAGNVGIGDEVVSFSPYPSSCETSCGGECPACENGQSCLGDADCQSRNCVDGICTAASCTNNKQDGLETDVDCGGPDCFGCEVTEVCRNDHDCATLNCLESKTCGAASCFDGKQNGEEQGIDCGGNCDACDLTSPFGWLETRTAIEGTYVTLRCQDDTLCLSPFNLGTSPFFGDEFSCFTAPYADFSEHTDSGWVSEEILLTESLYVCWDVEDSNGRITRGWEYVEKINFPALCSNGEHDVSIGETDIDCGGNCPSCDTGDSCGVHEDCASSFCLFGTCTETSCSDGFQNGHEEGIDCGFACGVGCVSDGGLCPNGDLDCRSLVCVDGMCRQATCDDNVLNGNEEGIDCGGDACDSCSAACVVPTNCQGDACFACDENSPETFVDSYATVSGVELLVVCDDSFLGQCSDSFLFGTSAIGTTCVADQPMTFPGTGHYLQSDPIELLVSSTICWQVQDVNGNLAFGTQDVVLPVLPESCGNGVQDGLESDVDCGGNCAACTTGDACAFSADCNLGFCSPVTNTCSVPSCSDGFANDGESDVDCGGPCDACDADKVCEYNYQCSSLMCEAGFCAEATCDDGKHNGDETGVDCGGPCGPCDDVVCIVPPNCQGNECFVCDTTAPSALLNTIPTFDGTFIELVCFDNSGCDDTYEFGIVELGESCVLHQRSFSGSTQDLLLESSTICWRVVDVVGNEAVGQQDVLVEDFAEFCNNDVLDTALGETGVDCGGPCPPCDNGDACIANEDCLDDYCVDFTCVAPSCSDGVLNGDEAGVDCGMVCPQGCVGSGVCESDHSCSSLVCEDGLCQAPSCSDGVQNGLERGVDCGGPCEACPIDVCEVEPDCQGVECFRCDRTAPFTWIDKTITLEGTYVEVFCVDDSDCDDMFEFGTVALGSSCSLDEVKSFSSQQPVFITVSSTVCWRVVDVVGNEVVAQETIEIVDFAQHCSNGVQDTGEGETGVDCGGSCPPCSNGQGCFVNADCVDNYCSGGLCAEPSCSDGVQNGQEGGIDCGVVCSQLCEGGSECDDDQQCASLVCEDGICESATCDDRKQNGDETGVDCGGPDCASCGSPNCVIPANCVGEECFRCDRTQPYVWVEEIPFFDGVELRVHCTDNSACEDEQEIGFVRLGEACEYDEVSFEKTDTIIWSSDEEFVEESTTVCWKIQDVVGNLLIDSYDVVVETYPSSCDNGDLDGSEIDVDCGGECPLCGSDDACFADSDCASGYCSGGLCAEPSCSDGVQNGQEDGLDCGPACLDRCEQGADCRADLSCVSLLCTNGRCQAASCSDEVLNGAEEGIDCGGECLSCLERTCFGAEDCASGICVEGICAPPDNTLPIDGQEPESCSNGVQDELETDIDCGGLCDTCADGSVCEFGYDCTSSVCVGSVCIEATCEDGVQNGDEAGVDCGGPCEIECVLGQGCQTDIDCSIGLFCSGGVCTENDLSRNDPDLYNRSTVEDPIDFNTPGEVAKKASLAGILLLLIGFLCIAGGGGYIYFEGTYKKQEVKSTGPSHFRNDPLAPRPATPLPAKPVKPEYNFASSQLRERARDKRMAERKARRKDLIDSFSKSKEAAAKAPAKSAVQPVETTSKKEEKPHVQNALSELAEVAEKTLPGDDKKTNKKPEKKK